MSAGPIDVRLSAAAVLCSVLAGACEPRVTEPPPPPSRHEIVLAPPGARGARAAGTEGAPQPPGPPELSPSPGDAEEETESEEPDGGAPGTRGRSPGNGVAL